MKNTFSDRMQAAHKSIAEKILNEVGVAGMHAEYQDDKKVFTFFKGRHLVTVPQGLVDGSRWSDIRYLFRAFLNEGPSVKLTAAENSWEADWNHAK